MTLLNKLTEAVPGCAGASDNGDGTYTLGFNDGASRFATTGEILSAAKGERIEQVKVIRDRTKSEGVTVGEHRFHSDPDSRTQQLGLVIMGANVPPVQWKTMAGSFVTMTPTLAGQIFQATAARDMAVFGHAEALIAAINSAQSVEEVDAIDTATDWPA